MKQQKIAEFTSLLRKIVQILQCHLKVKFFPFHEIKEVLFQFCDAPKINMLPASNILAPRVSACCQFKVSHFISHFSGHTRCVFMHETKTGRESRGCFRRLGSGHDLGARLSSCYHLKVCERVQVSWSAGVYSHSRQEVFQSVAKKK